MLLHLLILWLFTTNFKEITFLPTAKQEKKISLNLKNIVTPPPKPKLAPKAKLVPKPIVKVVKPKPIIEKKITPEPIKKQILDQSKKHFAQKNKKDNNATKEIKKIVKKKIPKKVEKKRKEKKRKEKKRPKRSKDPLANALLGAGTSMHPQRPTPAASSSYASKMIHQLYGKSFNQYSETQKKFIKNNLGVIHRITQSTLNRNGYPRVAVKTRQQGTNVVSFYLHPNGDITGLKLQTSIGYHSLDQNTLDVIRIAYKNYPLPNQKTKIMFYVRYSLY